MIQSKKTLPLAVATAAILLAALLPSSVAARSPERQPAKFDLKGQTLDISKLPSRMDPNRLVMVGVELQGQPVSSYVATAAANGHPLTEAQKADLRGVITRRQADVSLKLRTLGVDIQSSFTDTFNGFRVQVPAGQLSALARTPGVTRLYSVPVVYADLKNTDSYLGADKTWGQTSFTGAGVKLAVIDTGINYDHEDFNWAGLAAWNHNDPTIVEPGTFPTAKVIKGYDLVGDDYDPSDDSTANDTPQPDPDPLDCKDPLAENVQHGTHVSGIAAGMGVTPTGQTYTGPYNAATLSTPFRVYPGVAPQARIMIYKVFGCAGGTLVLADAIERAVRDGADVINMSIGSTFGNPGSLDAVASNNAALAGVTVVTSAGNEGPSAYAVGSPAVADRVIAVAAMDAQPSFPGATIDMPTGADISAVNANDAPLPVTGALHVFEDDPHTVLDPNTGAGGEDLGCDQAAYDFNHFVAGQVAVVNRGGCARTQKAQVGQQQGAAAVIMVNNVGGLPPFENTIAGVTIPFIGVDIADAARFVTDDGGSATIDSAPDLINESYKHTADFTSAGPRRFDSAVKPDVAAPGVSVFSADGGTVAQGKNLSGTSMASPAVAGVAALVKQAHPTWGAREIKAAIVGTASANKLVPYDVRLSGSGLAQPRRAVDTRAYVFTAPGLSSLTFGYDELKNVPGTNVALNVSQSMDIINTGNTPLTYDLANTFNTSDEGVQISISPSHVTVPAHSQRTVVVKLKMSDLAATNTLDVAPGHAPDLNFDDFGQLYTQVNSVAGVVVATPTTSGKGIYALRVPWQMVPRGTSGVQDVPGTRTSYKTDGNLRKASIGIRNYGLHAGIMDVYSWGLQDDMDGLDGIDLRAAGVQSLDRRVCDSEAAASDRCLIFAVNTWGRWSNASENEFDVNIDRNKDGVADFTIVGIDLGQLLDQFYGVYVTIIINDHTGQIVTTDAGDPVIYLATAPVNGSTMLLPALASDINIAAGGDNDFDYWVESFDVYDDEGTLFQFDQMMTVPTSAAEPIPARFDPFHPAIKSGQFEPLDSHEQFKLPLVVDKSRYKPLQGDRGWMVVTLEDANGYLQADLVPVGHLP